MQKVLFLTDSFTSEGSFIQMSSQSPKNLQRYVHIHPTNIVSSKANYNKEVLVISPKELDILKGNIKNFVKEFAGYDLKTIEEDYIYKAQAKHHLILEDIERIYAIKTIKEN